jgi:hypothetical protein
MAMRMEFRLRDRPSMEPYHVGRSARNDPRPRLERVGRVRVHAISSLDLIDPISLYYGLAIAAGAVAGMVVAQLRVG